MAAPFRPWKQNRDLPIGHALRDHLDNIDAARAAVKQLVPTQKPDEPRPVSNRLGPHYSTNDPYHTLTGGTR